MSSQIFSCALNPFSFCFLLLLLKYQTPNAMAPATAAPIPSVVGSATDMSLFAIHVI